jgi:hypothetical protein
MAGTSAVSVLVAAAAMALAGSARAGIHSMTVCGDAPGLSLVGDSMRSFAKHTNVPTGTDASTVFAPLTTLSFSPPVLYSEFGVAGGGMPESACGVGLCVASLGLLRQYRRREAK